MPIGYDIDREQRLVTCTGEGRITLAEFRTYQARLITDPRFDPTFNQLIDSRRIAEIAVPASDGVDLATLPTAFSKTSRRAWLIRKREIDLMITGLLVDHMSSHSEVRVFHDLKSALEWLGVREDQDAFYVRVENARPATLFR